MVILLLVLTSIYSPLLSSPHCHFSTSYSLSTIIAHSDTLTHGDPSLPPPFYSLLINTTLHSYPSVHHHYLLFHLLTLHDHFQLFSLLPTGTYSPLSSLPICLSTSYLYIPITPPLSTLWIHLPSQNPITVHFTAHSLTSFLTLPFFWPLQSLYAIIAYSLSYTLPSSILWP